MAFNGRDAGHIAGSRTQDGYAAIKLDGCHYLAHRLAFLFMTGSWPKDQVDHRNGWKLDNAWSNLREASHSENMSNRPGWGRHPKGVTQDRSGRFRAAIRKDGSREYLGTFDTPEEAHATYVARARELHGMFARP
ncbi:HNH endonuclease [Brevundimonas sp. C43]|uniref:HNH endonuclease n=1 Tax=Brevundimonas sp. C43 TaxID=3068314 RepID=UPI00273E5361|nr:HNH endonuclease [Brevundimonas sp. C43]